uniref:EcoEI_R_C domain-containing protein n=1 Tax=Caenorhabditis tropicalis TaxID=1561998 RepID=A0A1I7UBK8_9PELO
MQEALPVELRGNFARWGEQLTRTFVSHIIENNDIQREMQLFRTIRENMQTEKNPIVLFARYRTYVSLFVFGKRATELNDVDKLKIASKFEVTISDAFAERINQQHGLRVANRVTEEDVQRLREQIGGEQDDILENNTTRAERLYNFLVDFCHDMNEDQLDEYAPMFDGTLGDYDDFRNETIAPETEDRIIRDIVKIFDEINVQIDD